MKKFAFLLLVAVPLMLNGQVTDDFSDGNDDGWTHYDPIGSHPAFPDQATFTVVNGTYRIQTAPSPLPGTVGHIARAAPAVSGWRLTTRISMSRSIS